MKDYFDIKFHKTTYRAEIMAGITMFLSTVYILVVNPTVLQQCGMDYYSVFLATVFTSAISTFVMSVYAKMPILLAPGLSMNVMFVVVTMRYFHGDYKMALLGTYLSGVLFLALVVTGIFREIDNRIPDCVKSGVLAGLGLALMRTGLNSVQFFEKTISKEVLLTIIGIVVMWILRRHHVSGFIIYGMLITAIVGCVGMAILSPDNFVKEISDMIAYEAFEWKGEQFFRECFHFPSVTTIMRNPEKLLNLLTVTAIFTIYHFADAVGTTSSIYIFMKETGMELPASYREKSMYVNGIAGMVSGLFGTSSATSYAESTVGVAEGAKTGVASLTASILFLLFGFVIRFVNGIPTFITAPTLIVSGVISCMILKHLKEWKWVERVIAVAMTLYIGFTFQIANGVIAGMLVYMGYLMGIRKFAAKKAGDVK